MNQIPFKPLNMKEATPTGTHDFYSSTPWWGGLHDLPSLPNNCFI